jgi:hypothetical protein
VTLIGLTGGIPRYNPYEALAGKLVLAVDWRRDDLVTVSGSPPKASSILDVISGADFAQASGSQQLGYAPPGGFTADGSDDNATLASTPMPTGGNPFYFAAIVDQQALPADTTARQVCGWGLGSSTNGQVRIQRYVLGGVNRARVFVGSGAASPNVADGTVDFSGKHVIECWSDGASIFIAIDGGAPTSTACVPNIGTTRTRIAANASNTAAGFWQGALYLMHWFSALPTTDERAEYVYNLLDLVSTLP